MRLPNSSLTPLFVRLALSFVACAPSLARGQMTERVNVDSNGAQANNEPLYPSISSDGRFVVFSSRATNLVPGDTNGVYDVFLRDRLTGVTERLSVDAAGNQADQQTYVTWISADGRFVTFGGPATNLVPGDTNGFYDVFLRDRVLGTIERVSVDSSGAEGNNHSASPSGTPDGRFIVFSSDATNLVAGDTNGKEDIFIRDRLLGTTERISVNTAGVQGDYDSFLPSISDDGRFVAFTSYALNMATPTFNYVRNSFVRDRLLGTTVRVNVSTAGAEANGDTMVCTISGNGGYVLFHSLASNLISGDTNGTVDVFLRDLSHFTTERVDLATGGAELTQGGSIASDNGGPTISDDGRFVVFHSSSLNAVPGKTTTYLDCFIRDRLTATTERVSVSATGLEANGPGFEPVVSSDGRFVAFMSRATNLVSGDTNNIWDAFVRDRAAAGFSSECDAGTGEVASCPCGNPPNQIGKGCDNSAGTGGATLFASGAAYLSADSLTFTTTGEGASVLSIVMQGNGAIPGGKILGHGVRCLGGNFIRRLFTKHASSGSILAPDPAAGDATVSAQSALRGDVIHAGESRWYLVWYRDPVDFAGCETSSRYSATQTGRVTWSL